ncbi:GH92 family glycosyl hydrolase [Haloferula sargassicola]|uniref:Alpha-1,2-mannosidase n=1 Tax=Haloferula sargassicola TaxID=490096 RepID=A0ABP9UWG7_9BACT
MHRAPLLGLSLLLLAQSGPGADDPLAYVDPEIGTAHSRWFFYTPAAVPYGMAKLAPSTNGHEGNPSGWEAVGYDARHESIAGFVHSHEWQIGGVCFMPTTGELQTSPGDLSDPASGYRSRFKREKQISQAGFYQVHLDDYGITAELTATKRVGFHRYTFPASDSAHILLDIGNKQGESSEVTAASVRMVDDLHFEGFVRTYPKYVERYDPQGSVTMYFHGVLDKKPAGVTAFNHKGVFEGKKSIDGKGAGLALNYATKEGEKIGIKVGLSYTSIAAAKANLQAEAASLSFDEAKAAAQNEWRKAFGRIAIEDESVSNKTKFYTGLFHALLGRGVACDVSGDYPKFDGSTGHFPEGADDPKRQFINSDAIWGGYWNLTQLWALSYPEWYSSFVHTQMTIYRDRGWFADGFANSAYASGVGTNMVGLAIAGAYQTGILEGDMEPVYEAVRKNELGWKDRPVGAGKADVKAFVERGYVPFHPEDRTDPEGSNFASSHTLEYSFSAHAAAQMALDLGKNDDHDELSRLAKGWRHLFNPENRYIQPKTADGNFIDRFNPQEAWRGFQEGNAVQYSFFVPHQPVALIEAIGRDEFNQRLNRIFEVSEKDDFSGGQTIDAFAGVQSLYNHGNQPCLHISWLFNFSGKPWLTQKWTRRICDRFYGTDPVHGYGRGQDEDQGQLGAWFVMASLGIFDVKGLTDSRPIVELGSPLFEKATVQLGKEKTLVIETANHSAENVYVQSASFDGEPLDRCWLFWDELAAGGTLRFTLGAQPREDWGVETPPPGF